MTIRVTQHTMYNNMVGQMQKNLGAYMESVEQGSSQKKVNRPSDDPAGTYRILTTRQDLTNTAQYQENVDTAKGWLNLADNVLSTQVTTAITGLKALAEQASTGTYTAAQRQIMADQARQYFGQLLNLSNTEFEGNSIFGGHKYDKNAFEETLAVTTWDNNWANLASNGAIDIKGASASTVMIQFTKEGELNTETTFRWSNDGGQTWKDDGAVTVDAAGNFVITPGDSGVVLTIPKDAKNTDGTPLAVGKYNEDNGWSANNGSLLYVRPTAEYKGDDNDAPVNLTVMGNKELADAFDADKDIIKATGAFGGNVLVRFDTDAKITDGEEFTWSYSTDGGSNWITAKGSGIKGSRNVRLPIPGGYMDIDANEIKAGTQIQVHPARADLGYEIMKDTYLTVNSVGKDVFGGYYQGKPAIEGDENLFEVVGSFIGYLEGNNQEGCQKTLAALTKAEERVLAEATRIGGMENRIEMAADVLSYQKIDQGDRLSYVEDIDLTELLTKLTRQQLTYQTVLQSSSMIMQLSLAKYI